MRNVPFIVIVLFISIFSKALMEGFVEMSESACKIEWKLAD
jgi:hypothetical protein